VQPADTVAFFTSQDDGDGEDDDDEEEEAYEDEDEKEEEQDRGAQSARVKGTRSGAATGGAGAAPTHAPDRNLTPEQRAAQRAYFSFSAVPRKDGTPLPRSASAPGPGTVGSPGPGRAAAPARVNPRGDGFEAEEEGEEARGALSAAEQRSEPPQGADDAAFRAWHEAWALQVRGGEMECLGQSMCVPDGR
jgi:hypothetical protein